MPDPQAIGPGPDAGQRKPTVGVGHGGKRIVRHKDVGLHPNVTYITDEAEQTRPVEDHPHMFSEMGKSHVKEGFIWFAIRVGRMQDCVAVPYLQESTHGGDLDSRQELAVTIVENRDARRKLGTVWVNPFKLYKDIRYPPVWGENKPLQWPPRAADLLIFPDGDPLLLRTRPRKLYPSLHLPCPRHAGEARQEKTEEQKDNPLPQTIPRGVHRHASPVQCASCSEGYYTEKTPPEKPSGRSLGKVCSGSEDHLLLTREYEADISWSMAISSSFILIRLMSSA